MNIQQSKWLIVTVLRWQIELAFKRLKSLAAPGCFACKGT
ncbi:hypothetical protein ECTX1999_5333 [Escherichia coli TX1999]|nr:hypothetical protein ECTX1999_5333 [Escherichia coli TX1999]